MKIYTPEIKHSVSNESVMKAEVFGWLCTRINIQIYTFTHAHTYCHGQFAKKFVTHVILNDCLPIYMHVCMYVCVCVYRHICAYTHRHGRFSDEVGRASDSEWLSFFSHCVNVYVCMCYVYMYICIYVCMYHTTLPIFMPLAFSQSKTALWLQHAYASISTKNVCRRDYLLSQGASSNSDGFRSPSCLRGVCVCAYWGMCVGLHGLYVIIWGVYVIIWGVYVIICTHREPAATPTGSDPDRAYAVNS
jgi:hypothetical protein